MTSSIAQSLFNLIEDASFNFKGLELLSQLLKAHVVRMYDRVEVNKQRVPLARALLSLADPGNYSPNFYTPEAATQLLELDPTFFSQPYDGFGRLWLEHALVGVSRQEDASQSGFITSSKNPADQWAVIALSSLSDAHKASDELWRAALRLGLPQSAQLLVAHRPSGWSQVDEKAKPLIAQAGAWAWEKALEAGMDPYALTPKGQPFWRAMLPGSSSTTPEKDSVRFAVEAWMRQEMKKPDSSPAFMDYIRKNALARMGVTFGANAWARFSHSAQFAYVSTLPKEWVNWNKDDVPVWLRIGTHKDTTVPQWLAKINKDPCWVDEIKKDPLSHMAFEILQTYPSLPEKLSATVDYKAALSDPRKDQVMQMLKNMIKQSSAELDILVDSLQLQANTESAPSQTRRGPRL